MGNTISKDTVFESSTMASRDITKEGHLEKKSRFLGLWRKRWTVLTPDARGSADKSFVSTYKKAKEYKKPTESIRIDNATDIKAFIDKDDKDEVLFFIQNTRDKEKFLFRAESKQERDEWIQCITNANKKKDKKDLRNIINGTDEPIYDDQKIEEQKNELISVDKSDNDINSHVNDDMKQAENAQNNAQKTENSSANNQKTDANDTANNESAQGKQENVELPKEDSKEMAGNKEENIVNEAPKEIAESKPEVKEEEKPRSVTETETETVIKDNEQVTEEKVTEYAAMEETEAPQKGVESPKATEAVENESKETETETETEIKPEIESEQVQTEETKETQIETSPQQQSNEPKPEQEQPKQEPEPEEPEQNAPDIEPEPVPVPEQKGNEPAQEETEPLPPKEEEQTQAPDIVSEPPKEEEQVRAIVAEEQNEDIKTEETQEQPKQEPEPEEPEQNAPDIEPEPVSVPVPEQKENEPAQEAPKEETEPVPPKEEEIVSEPPKEEEQVSAIVAEEQNEDIKTEETQEQPKEETESEQKTVEPTQTEQTTEETSKTEEKSEETANTQSALSAAIAKIDTNAHANSADEAEDKFPQTGTTPVFKPGNIVNQVSEPEESVSVASSYRSDGGSDAPFGDRWGFGLNDTMDEGTDIEERAPHTPMDRIDSSLMEYTSAVIIGNDNGQAQLTQVLFKQFTEQKSDGLREFIIRSGEEKDSDIVCGVMNTSFEKSEILDTIKSISVSDMAIIVIDTETLDAIMDDLKEYVRVFNTYGIERCICCIDTFDENVYGTVQGKCEKMFKKIGIKAKKVAFVPVSCSDGDNVCIASENDALQWYKGWTMKKKSGVTVFDAIKCINTQIIKAKKLDQCFVMPVNSASITEDKCTVSGKIEQGTLTKGMSVHCNGNSASVTGITRNECAMESVKQGDIVRVSVDSNGIKSGDVLYGESEEKLEIKECKSVTALVVANCDGDSKLEIGFEGMICIRGMSVQCELSQINWKGQKSNSDGIGFLDDKEQGEVVLVLKSGMVATSFEQCECLGRFVVISENRPVLVGKIETVTY